ncbi:MAG: ankyrin repeat domain-containing protein [Pseudomonadota bacterium]
MKKLPLGLLLIVLFCARATAAGFDCELASSVQEKLICANPELSELDSQIGAAYQIALNQLEGAVLTRMTLAQSRWLRNTRNRCQTAACLLTVYKKRLNEMDPASDNSISCEEMRTYPENIFTKPQDLGSGHVSPVQVDYRCPESLSSLPFMQKLLRLAEQIHGPDGPQECSGSIVYAIRRHYEFDLAGAGFFPQSLKPAPAQFMSVASDDKFSLYFRHWGEQSHRNLVRYREFFAEYSRAQASLALHFQRQFQLSRSDAKTRAESAVFLVAQRAAGSFSRGTVIPDSALLRLLRTATSTPAAIRQAIERGANSGPYSDGELEQALRVALVHERPLAVVKSITERIDLDYLRSHDNASEPLLSLAVRNQASLDYLLRLVKGHGQVNLRNGFGETALFYAVGHGRHAAVKSLIGAGADVNLAYRTSAELQAEPLTCVFPVLEDTRRTALMHAAQHSDVNMLALLVAAGAVTAATDDREQNAMDYAVRANRPHNQAWLRAQGLRQTTQ